MRSVFVAVRWGCIGLIAIVFLGQLIMVLMRYLLGIGFLEIQDAVNYAFAALVALSVIIPFQSDRHVRVDVFRQKLSGQINGWIDWCGDLLLCLPVFGLMAWAAFPLVRSSWVILESSPETGGLPGLFLVKTCLVVLPSILIILALTRLIGMFRRTSA